MIRSRLPMMPDVRHNAVSKSSNASPDNLEEAMWQLNIEDGHEGVDGQLSSYPDRPGEPDCLYYLRTGNCGYGSSCKYNHPTHNWHNNQFIAELPQRDGQPDCQFFLKTGTCKYGTSCKYHHPRDKHDTKLVQMNVLGLPIRKDEKPCAYYMRTGSCKYGVACKFNHPDPQPVTAGAAFPLTGSPAYGYSSPMVPTSASPVIGGISPWPLSRVPYMSSPRMQSLPSYVPLVLPPTPGTTAVQQGWNTYMQAINACQGSMNHIYPANMVAPNQISNSKHQEQSGSSLPLYLPERPDQPECQYYMKTGSCKYGTLCKYHHPKESSHAAITTIGPLGLPLRPDRPVCTFYTTYGSCKFGTSCKYDHPLIGYYGYTLPSFSYTDPSIAFPHEKSSQIVWTAEKPSPKSSKTPNQFTKFETMNGQHNLENHEHGNTSAHTPSNTEPPEDSP
ncbi:zinc finger CCCH domain-containing protein 33-like isoform X1 [Zingiber officinale]|uniref:zinc finger CCCH domain-containing protein 33-like isoform X1 n=1 Tax=Zingiber officinale TaxID=94328 RepID=UPI001C4D306C|nr:zinc finger CCCH domain-containing protein 33-like isoform X1 [Zingiber officinale]